MCMEDCICRGITWGEELRMFEVAYEGGDCICSERFVCKYGLHVGDALCMGRGVAYGGNCIYICIVFVRARGNAIAAERNF